MILALDTSIDKTSVALADLEGSLVVAEECSHVGLSHSRSILRLIEKLMASAEITMADLSLIAVGKGPGSFTGIRIGVATALGLSHALKLPLIGVGTFEAMAKIVELPDDIEYFCATSISRKNEIFYGLYKKGRDGRLNRLSDEQTIAPQEAGNNLPGAVYMAGPGFAQYHDVIISGADFEICGIKNLPAPVAEGVAKVAMESRALGFDPTGISPHYITRSQAEVNFEKTSKN